jgi:hypothetical protein
VHLAGLVPRGSGNKEISKPAPFEKAARGVMMSNNRIAEEMGWRIERIAVDAPTAPPVTGSRASEIELGRCGLSSFRTPPTPAWADIIKKCVDKSRRDSASLPNKIWMLFGFKLFESLRVGLNAEVIEVYPFAIVRASASMRAQVDGKGTRSGVSKPTRRYTASITSMIWPDGLTLLRCHIIHAAMAAAPSAIAASTPRAKGTRGYLDRRRNGITGDMAIEVYTQIPRHLLFAL